MWHEKFGRVLLKTQARSYLEYDLGLVESDQILSFRALECNKSINIPVGQFTLQSCFNSTEKKSFGKERPTQDNKLLLTTVTKSYYKMYFMSPNQMMSMLARVHKAQGFACRLDQYEMICQLHYNETREA